MKTILLISPYWKEDHRWMVSSVKLAELWQRLGYRVVVAYMAAQTSVEKKSDTLTLYGKKDLFLPDPWNYGIAFGFSRFVKNIIKQEKPDIIVCNKILFWPSLSLIPLKLAGKKVILLTDALVGMTWWGRTALFRFASVLYAWTLGWLVMKCAHKIVFFHPQPDSLLRKLGVARKSVVIPTGIDPASYGDKGRSDSEITLTYVGRLESVKGVDDLLTAAVPLKQSYPSLTIQVVGWYKDNHPLVERYKQDVSFLGLRNDIADILGRSHLFVMPSHSEGLSNAVMEAMASGCACIASDVGGNAFLIHNGVSGLLFPVGDREALAAHIRRLLDDPTKRNALGAAARKRIEDVFSWDVVGKKYQILFDQYLLEQ